MTNANIFCSHLEKNGILFNRDGGLVNIYFPNGWNIVLYMAPELPADEAMRLEDMAINQYREIEKLLP